LEIFAQDDVLTQNRVKSQKLTAALEPMANHAQVQHFRNRGMIWAFDAVSVDAQQAATFSRRFFTAALEQELLLRPIGQTVYLMPPYILDDGEIATLAAKVQQVFEQVIAV
jgi:adenosylmethionine-8-amino-7-oxononanoate aminotransferase